MATAKFLDGDLMRHVVVMSLSASLGLVSVFLVDFADLYFISLLGEEALAAAVGFAGTLIFFVFSATIGLAIAMGALTAPKIGRGETDDARLVATSVMVFGFVVTFILAFIFWIWAEQLLSILGAEGVTLAYATRYLRIVLPSIPISAIAIMASALLRAHGDARRAMIVTFWSGGVNAVLDPLLIFGVGLGLDGAAYASVAARFAMALAALRAVNRNYDGFATCRFGALLSHLPLIIAIAAPAVLTNIATPLGSGIVTRAVAPFGDAAVAGFAVVSRLTPLFFCVIFALSGAVGPIVGQNFGARKFDRVQGTLTRSLQFVAGYTVIAWVLLLAVHNFASEQFGLTGEGKRVVFWFALVAAPLFFFNGLLFVANAAFNNLKRPIWSTFLNWGRNTIGVLPFVVLGADIGGAPGVLIGQALGGVVFGVLGFFLARRLVSGYAEGRLDPEKGWSFPLMRSRPDPPFSSPRG
ncbi:MAG: MATE family efflux transporter [Pseudomonadota bacterium]